MQSKPDTGDVAFVICTVAPYPPGQHYRFLHAPQDDILLYPKHRRPRRDLRPGDAVIAEVVRGRRGLIALHAVRLPKDWRTNGQSVDQFKR